MMRVRERAMFSLTAMKQSLSGVTSHTFYAMAGIAFTVLAMFAIQYEENIAPEVARVATAATDIGKKLTSLSF